MPGRPSPVVCIGTAHIRTTVVESRCEHTNDFDFLFQRSHYRRFQTLLCVYAPCLYAQRCLSLVVITQMLPKKFAKEATTAGSRPFSVYTHRTEPIRTAVFDPCCDCTNSSEKVRKRTHHSGVPAVCIRTVPIRTAAPYPRNKTNLSTSVVLKASAARNEASVC